MTNTVWQKLLQSSKTMEKSIKELILCFQKLVSGELHTLIWEVFQPLESGTQSPAVHD